jgi:hypothetical protein
MTMQTTRTAMRALLALTLAMATGAGCDSVSIDNGNPLGTVAGVLIDAASELPLMGASVQLVTPAGTLSATTDTSGVFKVEKVPAGSFILQLSADGHQPVSLNQTLAGNVGNVPVRNPSMTLGPLGLLPIGSSFSVRLVSETGGPAEGVSVSARLPLRWIDFSSGEPVPDGSFSLTATSDAAGLATFPNFPDFAALKGVLPESSANVEFQVAPTLVMGSGGQYYSFFGLQVTFNPLRLAGDQNVPTLLLAGPRSDLTVLESSISYLRHGALGASDTSIVKASGPIYVAFNQAISAASVRAYLTLENGQLGPNVPTLQATTTLNVLKLVPNAPLAAGARYNLHLRATAQSSDGVNANGRDRSFEVPFFVETTLPVSVVSAKRDPLTGLVTVVFSEPIGSARVSGPAVVPCGVFWEQPVDFNGTAEAYWGEYQANAASLVCDDLGQNLPTTPAPPNPDLSQMTPTEVRTGTFLTGLSSVWTFRADTSGCRPGYTDCRSPGVGDKAHFVFSLQSAGQTIRRASGAPVGDGLTTTID